MTSKSYWILVLSTHVSSSFSYISLRFFKNKGIVHTSRVLNICLHRKYITEKIIKELKKNPVEFLPRIQVRINISLAYGAADHERYNQDTRTREHGIKTSHCAFDYTSKENSRQRHTDNHQKTIGTQTENAVKQAIFRSYRFKFFMKLPLHALVCN